MASILLRKIWATSIVVMDSRLSDKAKLVFQRLVDRQNSKSGDCFPSIQTLAADVGCTTRTIRSATRELEKLKYVVVHRKKGPYGTNRYSVWLPSGNSEYQAAEKERRKHRKAASPKPMKKPMKEPCQDLIDTRTLDHGLKHEPCEEGIWRELEKRSIEVLGGDGEAWSKLTCLSPEFLESTTKQVHVGEITLDEALEAVLREADEGPT